VVEAVTVLELGEPVLEHVVEGGAEQAAEQVGPLGQAADPQVDVVQAGPAVGPGPGVAEEVGGVGRRLLTGGRVDQQPGRYGFSWASLVRSQICGRISVQRRDAGLLQTALVARFPLMVMGLRGNLAPPP
jgi:hypothetical protein